MIVDSAFKQKGAGIHCPKTFSKIKKWKKNYAYIRPPLTKIKKILFKSTGWKRNLQNISENEIAQKDITIDKRVL